MISGDMNTLDVFGGIIFETDVDDLPKTKPSDIKYKIRLSRRNGNEWKTDQIFPSHRHNLPVSTYSKHGNLEPGKESKHGSWELGNDKKHGSWLVSRPPPLPWQGISLHK